MKRAIRITVLCFLVVSCSGASSDQDSARADRKGPKIGGCVMDTIAIGTGLVRAQPPRGAAARIEILSVNPVEEEVFRRAADELTALLDTAGIAIYSRSELLHIKKGACWPPYRITFLVDAGSREASEPIRAVLEGTNIAEASPASERPKGYGLFFVTCGRGDRDWWTVWYAREE